ncbi:MAG: DUF6152 family protein [Gammaproteobacteria bacterium]
MQFSRTPLTALLALIATALPAHHSPIIFDTNATVVIEGRISRYDWTNPHSYIFVESVDDEGVTTEWQFETDSTNILARNGWTPDTLSPGQLVTVRGNPDRNANRAHAMLISLETTNGSLLTPTAGNNLAPEPQNRERSFEGIWEQQLENFVAFRAAGLNVVTTEAGTAARDSYDVRTENPVARCVAYPSPMIVAVPQHLSEITIHEDHISIHNEFFDVERVIYTDGRGHPDDSERINQGHSIGSWEDDVLVVETTLFSDHRSTLPGTGLPSGAQKRVVERYALSEDGARIDIDILYEDPEFLAEPFTGRLEWNLSPYEEITPFRCEVDQATRFMAEPPSP